MKMKEIKGKNDAELEKLVQSSKEKVRSLRFKVAQKQVKDVRSIRQIKKDLARLLTELKIRQQQAKNKPTK